MHRSTGGRVFAGVGKEVADDVVQQRLVEPSPAQGWVGRNLDADFVLDAAARFRRVGSGLAGGVARAIVLGRAEGLQFPDGGGSQAARSMGWRSSTTLPLSMRASRRMCSIMPAMRRTAARMEPVYCARRSEERRSWWRASNSVAVWMMPSGVRNSWLTMPTKLVLSRLSWRSASRAVRRFSSEARSSAVRRATLSSRISLSRRMVSSACFSSVMSWWMTTTSWRSPSGVMTGNKVPPIQRTCCGWPRTGKGTGGTKTTSP